MRAEQIFDILDINGDGELEEDEFISGCLKDQELITLLNSGGLEEMALLEEEDEDDEKNEGEDDQEKR